jgi:transposase
MNKFSFKKFIREKHKEELPSSFDSQAITNVFTCYQNKFSAIQKNLSFNKIIFNGFEFYKRNTKNNNKGDFKKVSIKKEKTSLSICLTYLCRYGNESTIDYINSQIENGNLTDDKLKFYNSILYCIDKFGFDRLLKLAINKRNRTVDFYSKKPIEFKSLSFSGRSRKTKIISYNKHFGSVINSFVSLSGTNRKTFDIPVKFNKNYHGNMKDYLKSNPDYEYVITFNEKHKQVTVNICKDGQRVIPENKTNYIGIDVNVKHNLFSLSNNSTYDYNRDLVNDYSKLSSEIDEIKKDKKYKVGKRKQFKLDKLRLKMKKSNEQLISGMCKDLNNQGFDHIVMENLVNGFGKSYVKDTNNEDINFNRIIHFMGISSLKQMVEHIAFNYDICVSTVHPEYTSKMCPICGCIEDENRSDQEHFHCINCGHEDNADHNASINIRNRVSSTVLKDKLLKQLGNGSFEPKNLKRDKVKELLLSFRRSNVSCREVIN